MGHHAVDAVLLEGVVCGKATEARLVHGMVLAIWEMLLQKVKERLCGGLLRVPLSVTRLGQHTDLPSFCVDINSYVNLLSLEGNFVSLHIGTVLIVCHLSFVVCTTNIQSNYYRTNSFLADYEKHRGGLPCGRRREASEERGLTRLNTLAFANIVTSSFEESMPSE